MPRSIEDAADLAQLALAVEVEVGGDFRDHLIDLARAAVEEAKRQVAATIRAVVTDPTSIIDGAGFLLVADLLTEPTAPATGAAPNPPATDAGTTWSCAHGQTVDDYDVVEAIARRVWG